MTGSLPFLLARRILFASLSVTPLGAVINAVVMTSVRGRERSFSKSVSRLVTRPMRRVLSVPPEAVNPR